MKKTNYLTLVTSIKIITSFMILLTFACCRRGTEEKLEPEKCMDCGFISLWKADDNGKIIIPVNSEYQYNYNVVWSKEGDSKLGGKILNITSNGDYTINVHDAGRYVVKISGNFPTIYFDVNKKNINREGILDIMQWGNIKWKSMKHAFYGCSNLKITAKDSPNLSEVTSMEGMFWKASSFNQAINNWDVSKVTNMKNLFRGAWSFNQPIGDWNVKNVVNMESMFKVAKNFNQNINNWNVSNVNNMKEMFSSAENFNQPVGFWNVGNVTNMREMFLGATFFNQNLNDWKLNSNVTKENSGTMFSPFFNRINIESWGWW